LLQKKDFGTILKTHAGVRADEYVAGCLWIMATTGAEGIIPFSPKVHHTASGGVARNKFGEP